MYVRLSQIAALKALRASQRRRVYFYHCEFKSSIHEIELNFGKVQTNKPLSLSLNIITVQDAATDGIYHLNSWPISWSGLWQAFSSQEKMRLGLGRMILKCAERIKIRSIASVDCISGKCYLRKTWKVKRYRPVPGSPIYNSEIMIL